MKSHKISKQSAGYKMMVRHGTITPNWDEPSDICEYRRCYIKTVLRILLIGFVVICGLCPIIDTAVFVLASYQVGIWYIRGIHPSTEVFWLAVLTLGGAATASLTIAYIMTNLLTNKDPSTVRLMYRTWKDKFCVPVEYE